MSTATSPLAADAVAGVRDATLRGVLADHWEFTMRWAPTWATTLGDHRYDDRLAPRDAAAIAAMDAEHLALLARIVAIDPVQLDARDAVTCKLMRGKLEAEQALARCKLHEWVVDSTSGNLFGELSYLVESHIVKSPDDARNLIARMRQGPRLIDDTIANLALGLAAGRMSSAEKVRRVIEQLDAELDEPIESWAMASPRWATRDTPHHRRGARTVPRRRHVPAAARDRAENRAGAGPPARPPRR